MVNYKLPEREKTSSILGINQFKWTDQQIIADCIGRYEDTDGKSFKRKDNRS